MTDTVATAIPVEFIVTDGDPSAAATFTLADVLETLPERIAHLIKQRGVSYRTAADQIGVSYADLHRFCAGKKDMRLSSLVRIVRWVEAQQFAPTETRGPEPSPPL